MSAPKSPPHGRGPNSPPLDPSGIYSSAKVVTHSLVKMPSTEEEQQLIKKTVSQLRRLMKLQGIPPCHLKRGHPERITHLRMCIRLMKSLGIPQSDVLKRLCLAEPAVMADILGKVRFRQKSDSPVQKLTPPPPPAPPSAAVKVPVISSLPPLQCVGLKDICDLSTTDKPAPADVVDDADYTACVKELDKWLDSVMAQL